MPSQDIVLGLYYITMERAGEPGEGMVFGDIGEIEQALEAKAVTLHTRIKSRYRTVDADGKPVVLRVDTTPGRMLLSEILPRNPAFGFELVNRLLTKKEISNVIDQVYRHCGQKETVIFCDRLMALGLSAGVQGRHLVRQGRSDRSRRQAEGSSPRRRTRSRNTSSNIRTA